MCGWMGGGGGDLRPPSPVICKSHEQSSSNYAFIGKKGRRFQLCHQFWLYSFGSRYGNVLNELVHRAGPSLLDK